MLKRLYKEQNQTSHKFDITFMKRVTVCVDVEQDKTMAGFYDPAAFYFVES